MVDLTIFMYVVLDIYVYMLIAALFAVYELQCGDKFLTHLTSLHQHVMRNTLFCLWCLLIILEN